jgi:hypothetical protein
MKIIQFAAPLMLSVMGLMNVQAQTVDDIIEKNVNALGGKDKIMGVKTIYKESDMDMMGNQASTTTYILNGKGYKTETDFGGSKIIQCITDTSGWGINPLMGQTSAQAMPDDQVKASQMQLHIEGPLVDYAAKGYKVELLGTEDVNGSSAYKLKVTTKDNVEITVFIDTTTYYAVKAVSKAVINGQDIETTVLFSNFQKTDYGLVVSYAREVTLPQGTITITDKKVEINKPIDPAIFEMPKD